MLQFKRNVLNQNYICFINYFYGTIIKKEIYMFYEINCNKNCIFQSNGKCYKINSERIIMNIAEKDCIFFVQKKLPQSEKRINNWQKIIQRYYS